MGQSNKGLTVNEDFFKELVTYYNKVKRRSAQCTELVELARQTIPECVDDIGKRTADVKEAV